MTDSLEPLPLEKLVDRWMMALGPEGSATHAGNVQVPADDLRRLVVALSQSMNATPVFDVTFDTLADQAAWEERFKLFSVPFAYVPFHEEGEKTQVKPRPFFRPALEAMAEGGNGIAAIALDALREARERRLGVVDMGTHAAEMVGHFDETGEAVITDVAGVTTGPGK